jgi:hypothetical protein
MLSGFLRGRVGALGRSWESSRHFLVIADISRLPVLTGASFSDT